MRRSKRASKSREHIPVKPDAPDAPNVNDVNANADGALHIVGLHPVREALKGQPTQVQKLWLLDGRGDPKLKELVALARKHAIPIHRSSKSSLDKMASGVPHQGAIAQLSSIRWEELGSLFGAKPSLDLLLALDQIEDPRNFGALVRAADGAGAQAVLVPHRRSAPASTAAISASAGAMLHTSLVRVRNLTDALLELKTRGFWVVGLVPDGDDEWHVPDYKEPTVLVVGSEAQGLRRRVRGACDRLVRLPQLGQCESLNVSVAAGIALYEVVRQRESSKQ